ncbi:hypothetical protein SAMN05216207_10478 [Pseudonocardia ammonioxydans]|uniref:Uncharacterized protein n=1 Tax=Pseudonocardia ammonioxydans TaxID=260086 RepID=A0A1I5GIE0_PSUAM|nr:hypothetical protein [Pseudonocardia ammonioxydans]SFO35765.1 hypothetical protein SAMN05216207_10478 [Pseudonocardia ammonioxydans]
MTDAMTKAQTRQAERDFTAAWMRAEENADEQTSTYLRSEMRRTARRLVELAGAGNVDGVDPAQVRAEFRAYVDGLGRPTPPNVDVATLAIEGRRITLQVARLEA